MYRSPSNATSPYAPPAGYGHRPSTSISLRDSSNQGATQVGSMGNESRSTSFGSAQAAARYEEAALHRQEMETIKRENEALKQKIRDLEKQLAAGDTAGNTVAPVPSI